MICPSESGDNSQRLYWLQPELWVTHFLPQMHGDKILDRLYHTMLTGTENWNQVQSWFVLLLYLGFKETTDVRKEYPSLLHDQTVRNMGHF